MGFKEDYYRLKGEFRSDKEIAALLFMSYPTLCLYKKRMNIPDIRSPRKNRQGLTEEQLHFGEHIGLSRRVMYQRVRAYGWSTQDACSVKLYEERKIGVEYGGK